MVDDPADNLIQQGQEALRRGNPALARDYLQAAVDLDPANAKGWLWLAGVLEEPRAARRALERVLELEPENARARQGLMQLQQRMELESRDAWDEPIEEEPTLIPGIIPESEPADDPAPVRGSMSIEQELRAALRISDDGTTHMIPSEEMDDDAPAPGPVRAYFQSENDDMRFRVAVAALSMFLLIGALCLVLVLVGVVPA